MQALKKRMIVWGGPGVVLLVGLIYAFWPRSVPVDLIEVKRGVLEVTVDEEAETRVRDIFTLSAPVSGRALRIEADVGDAVVADRTVIAEIEPVDPAFLDVRSEAQAQAALRAAQSAEALAKAEVEQAAAELEFARTELERARRLIHSRTIPERDLDAAQRAFKTRNAAHATALAALQVRAFEVERARAQLLSPAQTLASNDACECIPIFAPVHGRVLRVLHKSEGVVAAGEALVEIGDAGDLEIVADLLSSDAVKVAPGQRVIIEGWGGGKPLEGWVRRIEPFGFKKVSALGIEEQRVNVLIDFASPRESWTRLGHGFQVEVRVVLWEGADVLKLPLTALFTNGDRWSVFVQQKGRARRTFVEVGHRTGLEAEILEGLEEGDQVIVHPSDRVVDGVRVASRE
ncbi:MAG: efflux RND transporter periplasmic adaptor subunit [Gammaproteobacteria bacterium]